LEIQPISSSLEKNTQLKTPLKIFEGYKGSWKRCLGRKVKGKVKGKIKASTEKECRSPIEKYYSVNHTTQHLIAREILSYSHLDNNFTSHKLNSELLFCFAKK